MILTVITVAVLLVAAVSLIHGVTGAARDARLLKQSQKLSNGKRQLSVRNETSLVIEKEEGTRCSFGYTPRSTFVFLPSVKVVRTLTTCQLLAQQV